MGFKNDKKMAVDADEENTRTKIKLRRTWNKSLHTYKIRRFLSQGNIGQVFLNSLFFLNFKLAAYVLFVRWKGIPV